MATQTKPAALTPEQEAAKALEQRRQRQAERARFADVPIAQRAIAGALRERDHADRCPATTRPDGPNRVEAMVETVQAPSKALRQMIPDAQQGDRIIIVACQMCAERRYFGPDRTGRAPENILDSFVDERLEALAGGDITGPAPAELDSTL